MTPLLIEIDPNDFGKGIPWQQQRFNQILISFIDNLAHIKHVPAYICKVISATLAYTNRMEM